MSHAKINADVAQLAEQLICNQQVAGSSPIVGSIAPWGSQNVTLLLLGMFRKDRHSHLGQLNW